MKENQEGFFAKMKNAERSGFEITMFVISVVVALAVLISVIWLAIFWNKANSNKITDEEADASSVTESAVAVETEEPTATPYGSAIITDKPVSEDDDETVDEDLAKSKYGYTTAVVNLRSAASLTASVVTKVPLHAKVKLIKLHDKEWMEVTYNGMNGFINAMYLSANKPAPIATATPAPTDPPRKATPKPTKPPKTTKTPKPTKSPKPPKRTKTPEPDVTDEPTEQPTQKPTPEPTKVPTPVPTQKPTPEPTEPAEQPTADPAVE